MHLSKYSFAIIIIRNYVPFLKLSIAMTEIEGVTQIMLIFKAFALIGRLRSILVIDSRYKKRENNKKFKAKNFNYKT